MSAYPLRSLVESRPAVLVEAFYFSAGAHAEFVKDVREVRLDGAWRHDEALPDLDIREALGNELHDGLLCRSETEPAVRRAPVGPTSAKGQRQQLFGVELKAIMFSGRSSCRH
jgi:hypothetical protein